MTANYPTPIHLVSHPSADGTLTVYFITLASYQTSTLDTEGKNTFVSKTAGATAADLNGLKVTAQIDTIDDDVSNFVVFMNSQFPFSLRLKVDTMDPPQSCVL